MYTGSWSKCGRLPNAVSISVGSPRWFSFKGEHAEELKPTWAMVRKGYGYEEYVALLKERGVDPAQTHERYKDKIMLCFEPDRAGCHRGMLARWLKESIGVDVPEWDSTIEGS